LGKKVKREVNERAGEGQYYESTNEYGSPMATTDEAGQLQFEGSSADNRTGMGVARFEEIEDESDDECLVVSIPRCHFKVVEGTRKYPSWMSDFGSTDSHWELRRLFKTPSNATLIAKVANDRLKMFEVSEKVHPQKPTGLLEKRLISVWGVRVSAYLDFMGSSSLVQAPTDFNGDLVFQVIVPSLECAVLGLVTSEGEYGPDIAGQVAKYLPGYLLSKAGSPQGVCSGSIKDAFRQFQENLIYGDYEPELRGVVGDLSNFSSAVCTVAVLSSSGLFIAQLGSKTRAMRCGVTGGDALCHSENLGAFSFDYRSQPIAPEVLKYSLTALSDRKLIMLGTDYFWRSLPSKKGSRIMAGGLKGHYSLPTMCERLATASVARESQSVEKEAATCAAMNLYFF